MGDEMSKGLVFILKVVAGVLAAAVAGVQVWLVPLTAGELAVQYPEFASLKLPLLVLLECALLFVQGFLLCLWVLLDKVGVGEIHDPSSHSWVSALAFMPAGVGIASFVALFYVPGPPFLMLAILLGVLVCIGLVLLLVVMRGLLDQAVADRAELDVVI